MSSRECSFRDRREVLVTGDLTTLVLFRRRFAGLGIASNVPQRHASDKRQRDDGSSRTEVLPGAPFLGRPISFGIIAWTAA
jgi:hypothetical protein